jgi:hypothetical protein
MPAPHPHFNALQIQRNGPEEIMQPWNVLDATSIGLSVAVFATANRGMCTALDYSIHRHLCSVEVLVLFLRTLYYSMAVAQMGRFFRCSWLVCSMMRLTSFAPACSALVREVHGGAPRHAK